MSSEKSTAIIIPAFNEERKIRNLIIRIKELLFNNAKLVVVNDGSTDRTLEILKEINIDRITLCANLGYGVAVQTGVMYALRNNFEYAVLIDADGQHNPEDIFKLLDIVKNGEADLAIGSRFIENTGYRGNIFRRIGAIIFSNLLYCLCGLRIHDPTSGFQVFNRKVQEIYSGELFPVDYPDADMLLLLSYHNIKIKEIPVKMNLNKEKSIHSSIRGVIYYFYKMLLSILVVISYKKQIKRRLKNGY